MKIKLNVSSITKDKIKTRTYKNKEGEDITIKEYIVDLIPLKEKKFLTEGENWVMYKTHFLAEEQTKEEKAQKVKSKIVGDGIEFENKEKIIDYDTNESEVNIENDEVNPF